MGAPQPPPNCAHRAWSWVYCKTLVIGLHYTSVLFLLSCTQWLTLHISYPLFLTLLPSCFRHQIYAEPESAANRNIISEALQFCWCNFLPSQHTIPGNLSFSEFIFHYLDLSAHQVTGSVSFSRPQGRIAFLYLPCQNVNSWSSLCSIDDGRTKHGEWKLYCLARSS